MCIIIFKTFSCKCPLYPDNLKDDELLCTEIYIFHVLQQSITFFSYCHFMIFGSFTNFNQYSTE